MALLKQLYLSADKLVQVAIHGLTAMAPLNLKNDDAEAIRPDHPWPHGHGPIEASHPRMGHDPAPAIHGLTAMAPLKLGIVMLPMSFFLPSMASRTWPH